MAGRIYVAEVTGATSERGTSASSRAAALEAVVKAVRSAAKDSGSLGRQYRVSTGWLGTIERKHWRVDSAFKSISLESQSKVRLPFTDRYTRERVRPRATCATPEGARDHQRTSQLGFWGFRLSGYRAPGLLG